jgi:hypothetical protein
MRFERHPFALRLDHPWRSYALSTTTPAQRFEDFHPDLILREAGSGQLWAAIRGARFRIVPGIASLSAEDTLTAMGMLTPMTEILSVPDVLPGTLPAIPPDRTMLQELHGSVVWYCNGSKRFSIQSPDVRLRLGMQNDPVRLVPDGGLADIPNSGQVNWVG